MSAAKEKKENNILFCWGKKRGVGAKKGTQFYESFTYDGMEYFLYDSVCLYKDGVAEPFIGKLVKIWEQPVNKKRIKVHWFFRPSEVHLYLGDNTPAINELFLASGVGSGLFNVNPLEVLAGKCHVVCTSKDERNRQPSLEELRVADFIFYQTFNVGTCKLSEKFENIIAGTEVGYLFNQKELKFDAITDNETNSISKHYIEDEPLKASKGGWKANNSYAVETKTIQVPVIQNGFEDTASKKIRASDNTRLLDDAETIRPVKLQKFDSEDKHEEMSKIKVSKDSARSDTRVENLKLSEKQSMPSDDSVKKETIIPSVDADRKTDNQTVQVTKRPENDRSKWFSDIPWDEKIKNAYDQGRLVMLDNLDPDYSQAEVEDIMHHALQLNCSVRLIEASTFTNPNHGQALVVFKTSDAADIAVQKLKTDILMLPNGSRPLLASKGITRTPGKKSSALIGLLSIDKFTKLKRIREELRKAAAASHYSQPNTIEYEMAMEWMFFMHRSKRWWEELHESNRHEMKRISSDLNIK